MRFRSSATSAWNGWDSGAVVVVIRGSLGTGQKQSPDIATPSGVASLARTRQRPIPPPLPFNKRALELIQDRLEQIAQHGPAAGLHEHFRGHARGELQPG